MMAPGNPGVVRRIVASIFDVVAHWIVDALYHSAIYSESEHRREKALRRAVGGIDALGVAPLGNYVPVPQNDAVRLAALFGNGPEQCAESRNLSREVARDFRLLGLRECDRLFKQSRIESKFGRRLALPLVAGRRIVGGRRCLLPERDACAAGEQRQDDKTTDQNPSHFPSSLVATLSI